MVGWYSTSTCGPRAQGRKTGGTKGVQLPQYFGCCTLLKKFITKFDSGKSLGHDLRCLRFTNVRNMQT